MLYSSYETDDVVAFIVADEKITPMSHLVQLFGHRQYYRQWPSCTSTIKLG